MLYSLRLRLFLALLLVAILSIVLVALLAGVGTIDQFIRYVTVQDQQEQKAIATVIEHQIQEGGLDSIDPLAGVLKEAYGQEITLTGPEGEVIYSSDGDMVLVEERIVVDSDNEAAPSKPLELNLQNDGQTKRVVIPVSDRSEEISATTPAASFSDSSEQDFFGSINRIFIITAVVAVILAGIISLLLARRIIKPIKELTNAASRLETGDLSQRVTISGSDELGQLGGAFNAMAGSLERQEELRRHMVTDIAHELRTPLANLYGYLEAIEDGLVDPDPQAIRSLMEETSLLNQLVEDLQELSLAEAGELRLAIEPINLEPLIQGSVEALRAAAQAKSIALEVNIPDNLPLVTVDAGRTAQILRNLLNNSITHTPKNGRIIVTAEPGQIPFATHPSPSYAAPYVQIQVQDNGPGIDPDHQPYLFDRFYRADIARARTTGGSGLGLAISKMLVEAQGGEIWLKSIVGEGTAVGFTLPTTSQQSTINS